MENTDLDKRKCSDCNKEVLVITVEPPDDPDSYLLTTWLWVESYLEEGVKPFVLCDECCDVLYQEGRLGYSGVNGAFLVPGQMKIQ